MKPRNGLQIKTNSPRIQRYRKMILQLMLGSHRTECTTCDVSGSCKLQEYCRRYDVDMERFSKKPSRGTTPL